MAETDKMYTSVAAEKKKMQLLKDEFDVHDTRISDLEDAMDDAAHLTPDDGSEVIADFDPQADTVWKKEQTLSNAEKTQVQQNLGIPQTYATKSEVNAQDTRIGALESGKADKSTTLSGYGITNAYTKTEIDNMIINILKFIDTTKVVATYNVTDTSNPTKLCNPTAVGQFSEIEIDGVAQPSVVGSYTFPTTGIHIVRFTLVEPTSIGERAFNGCSGLTSIEIPSGVTSIGTYVFYGCSSLTSIIIPDSVTSIGQSAFQSCDSLTSCTIGSGVTSIGQSTFMNCSSLQSIVSNAMTAPTIHSSTFNGLKTGGTLTVPSGSTGYDTWMQNANYYLGLYGWTKVEQ